MKKTALVVMAAGIGSRFGGGIKQLEPVGPNGEIIMDYSIHDALEAGFNKIVFIIRKDLEADFKEIIGKRIEKIAEVAYVFQELEDLPEGFRKPEGRVKPWGTGQAVLAVKGTVQEPFAVINADDYYGKEAFVKLHQYLVEHEERRPYDFCMAGFMLSNTLSDNGTVTRGICTVDQGKMTAVTETFNIERKPDGVIRGEDSQGNALEIPEDCRVSMNMWGLTPGFLEELEEGFKTFLTELKEGDLKTEYLLPTIIDDMIRNKKAEVTVLETGDKWFGVTYLEDKQTVVDAIQDLIRKGVY